MQRRKFVKSSIANAISMALLPAWAWARAPRGGTRVSGSTVATPTFSPAAGSYSSTQTVTLSCSTPSSSIYYTTDGSTPTFPTTGTTLLYSAALTVSASETIKAIGVASGLTTSAVGSAAYTIGALTFDFFIAPNGDDNNAGTLASPWSITALNSKQSTYAGKKIGLIGDVAGTQTSIQYGRVGGVQTSLYSLIQANSGNNVGQIITINGGSSSASTYLGACNSSGSYIPPSSGIGCWTVIDCSQPGSGGTVVPTVSAYMFGQNTNAGGFTGNLGYTTIDGIAMFYFTQAMLSFTNNVQTGTVFGVVVQNCEIAFGTNISTNNNPGGLSIAGTVGAVVNNCKFHDMNALGSGSGNHSQWGLAACQMYGNNSTATATVFTNNTIYNCGSVWYLKDYTHSFANFSYNYCDHGSFGSAGTTPSGFQYGPINGLVTPAGATSTIHHNIFLGSINMHPTGGGGGTAGTIIAHNNTFYGTSAYGGNFNVLDGETMQAGSAIQFYNNVCYSVGTYDGGGGYGGCLVVSTNATISNTTFNNNVYGSNNNGVQFGNALFAPLSFASWKSGTGCDQSSVQVSTSPFTGTPTAQVPSSFAVGSSAIIGGVTCGALDGSGNVGCNF